MYLITALQTHKYHRYVHEERVDDLHELIRLNSLRTHELFSYNIVASIGIVSAQGRDELSQFTTNTSDKIVTIHCDSFAELKSHLPEAQEYYRQFIKNPK